MKVVPNLYEELIYYLAHYVAPEQILEFRYFSPHDNDIRNIVSRYENGTTTPDESIKFGQLQELQKILSNLKVQAARDLWEQSLTPVQQSGMRHLSLDDTILDAFDRIDWLKMSVAPDLARQQLSMSLEEDDPVTKNQYFLVFLAELLNSHHFTLRSFRLTEATPQVIAFLLQWLSNGLEYYKPLIAYALIRLTQTVRQYNFLRVKNGLVSPEVLQINVDTFRAIKSGLPLYRDILRSPQQDVEVRKDMLDLLEELSGNELTINLVIIEELFHFIGSESDVCLKAIAILRLGKILSRYEYFSHADPCFKGIGIFDTLLHSKEPEVRATAACSLSTMYYGWHRFTRWQSDMEYTPDELLAVAEQTLSMVEHVLADCYFRADFQCGSMVSAELRPHKFLDALTRVAWLHNLRGLLQLFHRSELQADDSHKVGREMLDLVFPRTRGESREAGEISEDIDSKWVRFEFREQQPPSRTSYRLPLLVKDRRVNYYVSGVQLDENQQSVLKAIVDKDAFWQIPTNLFSFFYGLPDSRDELRALIEQS